MLKSPFSLMLTTSALLLSSCGQTPVQTTPIGAQPQPAPETTKAVVGAPIAVTFTGLDSAQPSITVTRLGSFGPLALSAPSGVTVGSGAVVRSVTDILPPGQPRTSGFRYLHVTLPISATSNVTNLTLLAAALSGNAANTAVSALDKYPGGTAAPFTPAERDALAHQIRPTSPVTQDPFSQTPALVEGEEDALQVYDEADLSGLTLPAGQSGSLLPYGFVGHGKQSRTIAAGTNTGTVTLAVKIPLQAAAKDDPYTLTLTFVPVQDSETAITESPEAQLPDNRAAFQAALTRLGTPTLKTLPGSALFSPVYCNVRVAGAAGSATELFAPGTAGGPLSIPARNTFRVGRNASVLAYRGCGTGTFSGTASTTTIKVRGSQSKVAAQAPTLSSDGRSVSIPARTGGYFAGEEVEVSMTAGLGGTGLPQVFRYRTATSAASGTFSGAQEVGVGRFPYSVAVGDVNGDGDLDLLSTNVGSDTVSVRLNNGTGTFSGTQDVAVGTRPISVAVGDVNGDGNLDLLTTNLGSNTVSVRLNNGTGIFSGTQDVAVGSGPFSVALGDVDGDGDLDLLTANYSNNTVSVRLNNGTGTFSGTQDVAVGSGPYSVAVGDVDGDGDLDLLTANYFSSTVSVRLNNGTGTFSGGQNVAVGRNPRSVAVGDVNGDGNLDLLSANYNSDTVSVRLNNGTGIFSGTQDVAVGSGPYSVAVGDVNGDGNLDLLSANYSSNTVSVRLNNGTGTFSGGQDVAVGSGPYSVAVGDMDGDGDLDLLSANYFSGSVSVRLNQP